jgi:hypothetical protein
MMENFLPLVIGLVAVAIFVGLMVGTQFVPERWWFAGIALFSIPQVFLLPVLGVYPSLSLFSCLAPLYAFKYLPVFFSLRWFKALIAFVFFQMLSLAWSPAPMVGVRYFVYLLPFATALFIGFAGARSNACFAQRLMVFTLWLSIIEVVLVITFRISPSLESSFIGSRLAGFAISPNTLNALYSGSPNNIFDPAKSGGLFVNANTASAFLGFCAMVAWKFGASAGKGSLRFVALVNWTAVFFTGSKAGAILAMLVPGLAITLEAIRIRSIDMRVAAGLSFVGAAAVVVTPFAIERFLRSGFIGSTSSTLDAHQVIWKFAGRMFPIAPLQGLGFGGWEEKFPFFALSQGISPNYPPHNAFMVAWSQSGSMAAICLLIFVALFLHWTFKAGQHQEPAIRNLGNGLFFGAFWFWLQAQGENFGILGEQHFTTMLGLFSGALFAQIKSHALLSKNIAIIASRT